MTDKASQIKGLAWILAAAMVAAGLAFGISPLVRAVPWGWEKHWGQVIGTGSSLDRCGHDPQKEELLNQLVRRLYPLDKDDQKFTVDVQVVRNPTINAFAELGGRISLNSGLLENAGSPEEVAGVLAHEIEHVHHRHVLEGFVIRLMTISGLQMLFGGSVTDARWTDFFLHMGFSRMQEVEADQGALVRLQKAHIDNKGFGAFFQRMRNMESVPSFLSDHPADESRYDMVKRYRNEGTKPIMTHAQWVSFKEYCQ